MTSWWQGPGGVSTAGLFDHLLRVHPDSMALSGRIMVVLGGACLMGVGCAEDPRPARRATAIDVAGDWREVHDGGTGALLRLDNEEGLTDVIATLRDRTVTADEAAALARVPSPELRAALAQSLTLGAGRDVVREETDGGENVSFDGGVTTTLQLRSAPVPVAASTTAARDATLAFALRLDGDADSLAGTLAVLVSEVVRRAGDVDGFARETIRIEVPMRFAPAEE